jgi:hypothetical protein
VKKIIISGDKAKIHYLLPMPRDGKRTHQVGVLPIDTFFDLTIGTHMD